MNKKGFTLIELLAVIVILGIITVLIVPSLLSSAEKSKEAAYNILVKNIVTASELYYQECEYGDLSDEEKYGSYACKISNNEIRLNLGTLANTGFLSVNDTDSDGKKIVLNPKNNSDISNCVITIKKNITSISDDNGIKNPKITYQVSSSSPNSNCPLNNKYQNIE